MSEQPVIETTAVVVRDNSTLVALERAQIDQQIATAKAYPRSLQQFKDNVLTMATLDQETSESMTYALPRDGKLIVGPSVRLAEIAGSCWGNVVYGASIIEEGQEFLTARGVCYDLERNVKIAIDVRRSIVGKRGRYSANQIQVVGQAASAIALRNAIFKVIPMAFIKPAWEAARKVAAGDEKSLTARVDAALLWFKDKNVKPQQVFGLLGVAGKGDVTLEHLQQMTAIRVAVKDGESTLEDFFKESKAAVVSADLDAFTSPTAVTASDDPKERGPQTAPVVEATVVAAAPAPEKVEPKKDAKKKRTEEDEALDKLFS